MFHLFNKILSLFNDLISKDYDFPDRGTLQNMIYVFPPFQSGNDN